MMLRAVALLALSPLAALAGSLSSCGGASDHLSNVAISLSPDPIQHGHQFTLEFSGDLDEDLNELVADVELDVKVLSIINKKVSSKGSVALSPALPKGPVRLTVGPVTLDTGSVPGSIGLGGTIQVNNGKGEPVLCVKLDMDVPVLETSALQSTHTCGNSTGHISDLTFTQDSAGVTTISGAIDEPVIDSALDLHMTLKEWWLKIPISISTKIHFAPGIPKGPFKIVATPDTSLTSSNLGVEVYGDAEWRDGNNDQLGCLEWDDNEVDARLPAVV